MGACTVPQAPPGLPAAAIATESPPNAVPLACFAVTVIVEVDVPEAVSVCGDAAIARVLGSAVVVTFAVPTSLLLASVAVTVLVVAAVVDDVYVVVATPDALVVAKTGDTVPLPAVTANITSSPEIGVLVVVSMTVALIVDVDVPSAGMLVGEALTVTEVAGAVAAVWLICELLLVSPVSDSVAVTVQKPGVVDGT